MSPVPAPIIKSRLNACPAFVSVNPKPWTKTITTESKSLNNNQEISSNVLKAQKECKDIGFKENTEKFNNCVEMMK